MSTSLRTALVLAAGAALAALPPRPVDAQEAVASAVGSRIQEILARPLYRHARIGAAVRDLDTGRMLFERDADQLFTPGSTTKVLPVGTALRLLGPDHRFRTPVYRTGPVGDDGTLAGDLVLVASADPNLSNRLRPDGTLAFVDTDHTYAGLPGAAPVEGDPLEVLRDLARQVAAAGIRRVDGGVRVDASLFPEEGSTSPIVVNDNVVDVTVAPGAAAGAAPRVTVSPETSYLELVVRATTAPAGSASTLRFGAPRVREDGSVVVELEGAVSAGVEPVFLAWRVPVPSRFAELAFADALADAGVAARPEQGADALTGLAVPVGQLAPHYGAGSLVAEHVSAPYAEEAKVTLKTSHNQHAAMMPHILAAALGHRGPGAEQAGFDHQRKLLEEAGIALSGASQGDGAGGDRGNAFSPRFMVDFLADMAASEAFEAFHAALPVLGRDGTLAHNLPDSPAAGAVRAKTGTLIWGDRLNGRFLLLGKGLVGYIDRADGRRLAVAAFINDVPLPPSDGVPWDAIGTVGDAVAEIAEAAYLMPLP